MKSNLWVERKMLPNLFCEATKSLNIIAKQEKLKSNLSSTYWQKSQTNIIKNNPVRKFNNHLIYFTTLIQQREKLCFFSKYKKMFISTDIHVNTIN